MANWDFPQTFELEPISTRLPATESRIADFENHIGIRLPDDYRDFLSQFGGYLLNAEVPIYEPTPFGRTTSIQSFYGFFEDEDDCFYDIRYECDLAEGAPVAVPIAGGHLGQIFIICEANDKLDLSHGAVYFWDGDNRSAWPDEVFEQRFPSLGPEIRNYLEQRKAGLLTKKPDALADFYKVGDSFSMFVNGMRSME